MLDKIKNTSVKSVRFDNLPLPPACDGVSPCDDVNCQRAIAEMHAISELEFSTRIIAGAGPAKTLTAQELERVMSAGTCGADVIAFDQYVATNAELDPVATSDPGNWVHYSYPCMKGILSDNPEMFSFYLATGTSGNDVIFKVSFGGGATDRYYDFSQTLP